MWNIIVNKGDYHMSVVDVCLLKGNVIKDFKYSLNDEVFFYNVLTKGGDELTYRYTKEQHENILYEKECEMWRSLD